MSMDQPGATLDHLAPIDPGRFRELFGSICTPVSIVTAADGGHPHGTTVSAFTSLSLDPPLVLVSLDRGSALLRVIRRTRTFAINVLAAHQEELALHFARKGDDKFATVEWVAEHGLPRIPGCEGFVAGRVERILGAGDHVVVIGLVVEAATDPSAPLLYRARRFHALAGGAE